MDECPWSVARLHVRCSNSFSQLESIERERARVCVWAISIHEKPLLALFQMNFDLAGGQPSQGTLVWWAAGHTKGRWQSFRREEGPARGVRYLHSTIWVKCLPNFLQGSFYGCVMCESLLFHICASCLHAVRCVVHGGLSSRPQWQLLQIKISTHDKHHVFDLTSHRLGFLRRNKCPWQVQLDWT
jgi:hypothetical protein